MTKAKAVKKDPVKTKKAKKTEAKLTSDSSPAPGVSSVETSTEKSSDKRVAPPKSASQSSISHFSSVATEGYRSGWADIFGKKK